MLRNYIGETLRLETGRLLTWLQIGLLRGEGVAVSPWTSTVHQAWPSLPPGKHHSDLDPISNHLLFSVCVSASVCLQLKTTHMTVTPHSTASLKPTSKAAQFRLETAAVRTSLCRTQLFRPALSGIGMFSFNTPANNSRSTYFPLPVKTSVYRAHTQWRQWASRCSAQHTLAVDTNTAGFGTSAVASFFQPGTLPLNVFKNIRISKVHLTLLLPCAV